MSRAQPEPDRWRSRMAAWVSPLAAAAVSLCLLGLIRVLTGAQARWWGCPPKAEQRIYFANHQSHADLLMIWAALPKELRRSTRAVAAREYWTQSPFRQWITSAVFNVIYVARERNATDLPERKHEGGLHYEYVPVEAVL